MCRIDSPGWLVAGVLISDAVLCRANPGLAIAGALDESAHVATTLLIGRKIGRHLDTLERVGACMGSIMIDIDHVPLLILKRPMESAEDRPVTHSLSTLLVLTLVARTLPDRPRRFLNGLIAGTISHFVRDLATGGVPLVWPMHRRLIRVPYRAYAALLVMSSIRAATANFRGGRT